MSELLPQPSADDIQLLEILKAIGDPVRLQIVGILSDGNFHPCGSDDIMLGLHKSTMSHHYKVLREAGVTSTRTHGRNRDVVLRRADLDERFPGLLDSLVAGIPAGASV
ncbi:helix-turn-helix transcriptional regulator [Glaciihabitans sp. dw_435]|uniref:ArsR/SmtB family transcription factor n=1 Tax=Glaciihabitans sp. dw_435 TaxID=2720081 RepID=UPI001BD3CBC5|nr:ArsR family transcriptional regulator [Glaciihabitans sp. dw_435]